MATETGLRPGDLKDLNWSKIQATSSGNRRILLKTGKSRGKNFASIPVTARMASLIDTFPKDAKHFAMAADGSPFAVANSLGAAIHEWRDRLGVRKELRFYDARGTAVTRLVNAGCSIGELASHMGWSMSHAAAMLDYYAQIDPDLADGIYEKLARSANRRTA